MTERGDWVGIVEHDSQEITSSDPVNIFLVEFVAMYSLEFSPSPKQIKNKNNRVEDDLIFFVGIKHVHWDKNTFNGTAKAIDADD